MFIIATVVIVVKLITNEEPDKKHVSFSMGFYRRQVVTGGGIAQGAGKGYGVDFRMSYEMDFITVFIMPGLVFEYPNNIKSVIIALLSKRGLAHENAHIDHADNSLCTSSLCKSRF